ncbi:hypothetical protein AVEN_110759-1 [Araneus ventricosus]|uniref:Uncharacterized protein n=1 Tax=Araneus ventricosus TaxID=182803 RepID=A0A4Y2ICY3_ARAVE|nr:hypothetical protein AVEN_110759-1 [Araneus ventricosus]
MIPDNKINHTTRLCHPGNLNDIFCNSLSTEIGFLVTITDHDLTAPVGSAYYHWKEDSFLPITILQEKREPADISGGFLSTSSCCSPGGWQNTRIVLLRNNTKKNNYL